MRLDRLTAELPGVQPAGQGGVDESRRIGERPRGFRDCRRGALKRGLLGGGKHLLDATSGNTGIAYAMLGAAWGFPVTLCVPSNVSPERKRILAAMARMWCGPTRTMVRMERSARRASWPKDPQRYYYADQYGNNENWKAHYRNTGTANEIWKQTDGQVTHFVAGLGTSGTFVGTTRRLKELNPLHPVREHAAGFAIQRL